MRRATALCAFAALAVSPVRAAAQRGCGVVAPAQSWPSPLNRTIALRARDVSLREALDRVAAAARFRVSYSAEFLPLDRRVCLSSDSVAAGDALAELLAGVNVSTIVTSADQVVIAPSRPISTPRESVQTLDRVVVTGSAMGNAQRSLSVAVDVIDRRQLQNQSSGALSSSLDGNVAGMWLWEQSPSTLLARYGSIRGASSFGLSYPKVYIDGIEVANPLLLTDLNPASLDRVEVIRGPQGAALYGADAISGVVNIVTRHEGLQAGDSKTEAESRVGLSQTSFADKSVLAQNHSLSWRTGSNVRSGSLAMNVNSLGGYVPEAFSRDVKLNGAFKFVSSTASVTGTGRVFTKRAAAGQNPLIMGFLPSAPGPTAASSNRGATYATREDSLLRIALTNAPQTANQYTFGLTSTLLTGTTWVPSFSAGVDGYGLSNVSNDLGIIPSSLDSALHSAEGGAYRVTFRSAMVGQYDFASRRSLTLTFSGEHSRLQETLKTDRMTTSGLVRVDSATYRSNTGFVAQANYAMNEALYLTGGLRIERNDQFSPAAQLSVLSQANVLPMVGIAGVRELGRLAVKGRAAYGVGVRPARSMDLYHVRYASALDPERQSGVEFGADLFFDRRFALHVTRFDQRASGLIQQVAAPRDTSGPAPSKRIGYLLQTVGEIRNHGWEVESSYDLGYFALSGAFTTVNSRVDNIARDYFGDLRAGDRVLAVPAGTASLTANWNVYGWRAGMTATRAFDWINYDRLQIAKDYASCDSCFAETLTGAQLRSYWMKYDGVTRLRGSLSRELRRGVGVRLTADNLTNAQRGEPDNITVLPGRTFLLGVSAKIR
jgi:outer membrane receptor protein involved in Fe transport